MNYRGTSVAVFFLLYCSQAQSFEFAVGQQLFLSNCAACHQADGNGIPNVYPALSGSEVVNGGAADIIGILQAGRGDMPAFSGSFTAAELAALINFLRHSWNNAQHRDKSDVVSPEGVADLLQRLTPLQ